ncbi:unnamed protein product, partial [Didymodactylos carnosus]
DVTQLEHDCKNNNTDTVELKFPCKTEWGCGYDAANKDQFERKFICPQCELLLRDPVQLTNCGHRICQSCIRPQSE